MGGNITRHMQLLPSTLDNQNYSNSYVHKLITIGTPHLGSPVARELIKTENECIAKRLGFAKKLGFPFSLTNGAIDDLVGNGDGSGLSDALQKLQPVRVSTAVLAGRLAQSQIQLLSDEQEDSQGLS